MTSRAVKKILSQRNRDELEKMAEGDQFDDLPVITKKANLFDLLPDDDEQTEEGRSEPTAPVQDLSAPKKEPIESKQTSRIHNQLPKTYKKTIAKNDDLSLEEFEALISAQSKRPTLKQNNQNTNKVDNLKINKKFLDSEEEVARMFGSRQTSSQRGVRKTRFNLRKGILVNPSEYWPRLERKGLNMMIVENEELQETPSKRVKYFTFTHSETYREFERMFFSSVLTHNENYLTRIITQFPYHVNTLLQISEICVQNNEIPNAIQMIERALYICENSFHPLFNILTDSCRLPYSYLENRAFFIALHRYSNYTMRRGCWRTALEYTKLILKLDPENDPFFLLLNIDYYSIKAKEYKYILQFYNTWENKRLIESLPNFAYSLVLVDFYLNKDEDSAVKLLYEAVSKFPDVLIKIIEKCGITLNTSLYKDIIRYNTVYKKTLDACKESALKVYSELYVSKAFPVWKETESTKLLMSIIPKVNETISQNFKNLVAEKQEVWGNDIYTEISLNLCRHVLVSAPEHTNFLPKDIKARQMFAHDPLPPKDSTSLYNDFELLKAAGTVTTATNISQTLSSIYETINGYLNAPNQGETFNLGALRNIINNVWPAREENNQESSSEDE